MSCHLFASQDVANANGIDKGNVSDIKSSSSLIIQHVPSSLNYNSNPRYPGQGLTLLSRVNWDITILVDHRVILSSEL